MKMNELEHLFYFGGKPRKAIGNSWVDPERYCSFPCDFKKKTIQQLVDLFCLFSVIVGWYKPLACDFFSGM